MPVLLAVTYVAVFGTVMWRKRAFEIDPDEGYNLMKVVLVERGFELYREIWSDQPPAFTYLGVLFRGVFGANVESVRFATVLLAASVVFTLADSLRREFAGGAGVFAGLCCALVLTLAARFSVYGAAAMIGLPCIAFATLSLWTIRVSRLRRGLLVAAGVLFGLSLLTKLVTLFLLPIWCAYVAWLGYRTPSPSRLRTAATAALAFGAGLAGTCAAGLGPIYLRGEIGQLVASHGEAVGFGGPSLGALAKLLRPDFWLYPPALAGLLIAVRLRSGVGLVLGAWALCAAAVLATHAPRWSHHALLVSVPAAGLCGFLAATLFDAVLPKLPRAARYALAAAIPGILAGLVSWRLVPREPSPQRKARYEQEAEVERAVRRHAASARTAVVSRQMYAVRLGLSVPPELAVTSSKRFRSGQLSARRILTLIRRTQPEVVIIDRRWPESVRRSVGAGLPADYRMVYFGPRAHGVKVYVRGRAGADERSSRVSHDLDGNGWLGAAASSLSDIVPEARARSDAGWIPGGRVLGTWSDGGPLS